MSTAEGVRFILEVIATAGVALAGLLASNSTAIVKTVEKFKKLGKNISVEDYLIFSTYSALPAGLLISLGLATIVTTGNFLFGVSLIVSAYVWLIAAMGVYNALHEDQETA